MKSNFISYQCIIYETRAKYRTNANLNKDKIWNFDFIVTKSLVFHLFYSFNKILNKKFYFDFKC
jgi:hypothetical protein